jgi:hypothetical protein
MQTTGISTDDDISPGRGDESKHNTTHESMQIGFIRKVSAKWEKAAMGEG